jgi:hypothetical protein
VTITGGAIVKITQPKYKPKRAPCVVRSDSRFACANPSSRYPVVSLVTNVVIVICGIAAHDANELGLFMAGADHYFTVEACGSLHRGFAQPPTPGRSSRPSVEIPVLFLCRSKVEVATTLRDGVSH